MYIFVKMWRKDPLIKFINFKDLAFTSSPFYAKVQMTSLDQLLCHLFSRVFWFWVVRAVYWLSIIIEHILLTPYLSFFLNIYQRATGKVLRSEIFFSSEFFFVFLKYHVFSNAMCCHYHHPSLKSFTKAVARMVGKPLT